MDDETPTFPPVRLLFILHPSAFILPLILAK
jgi:hypothetical protein